MTSARSVRPVLILLAVYFLSMWAGAAAVHAQGVTPDVSLTCENPQPIETYPGSTRTSIVFIISKFFLILLSPLGSYMHVIEILYFLETFQCLDCS